MINMTKIIFVMSVYIIKNVVYVFKKYITLDVKSIQVKNLVRNIKKCHQNVFHQVIILL